MSIMKSMEFGEHKQTITEAQVMTLPSELCLLVFKKYHAIQMANTFGIIHTTHYGVEDWCPDCCDGTFCECDCIYCDKAQELAAEELMENHHNYMTDMMNNDL